MNQPRLALFALLLLPLACGDDESPADGGSESSGTEGTTGTATMTPTTMTATMTDSMGTMTGSSSTTSDESTTTEAVDSSGTTEATTEATTDTGSSSSGDMEEPAYPPCMTDADPVCPEPYDQCYDFFGPGFNVCSQTCMEPDDCPQPTTGDATVACAGPMMNQCVLDCAGGAMCPDGMECVPVGGMMFFRCAWAV